MGTALLHLLLTLGLASPLHGQRGIELALDAVLMVPRRLAVANKQQACWGWLGWVRDGFAGLGLLWARGSDTDIYTNFLLIPRSESWADLRR